MPFYRLLHSARLSKCAGIIWVVTVYHSFLIFSYSVKSYAFPILWSEIYSVQPRRKAAKCNGVHAALIIKSKQKGCRNYKSILVHSSASTQFLKSFFHLLMNEWNYSTTVKSSCCYDGAVLVKRILFILASPSFLPCTWFSCLLQQMANKRIINERVLAQWIQIMSCHVSCRFLPFFIVKIINCIWQHYWMLIG